MISLLFQIAVGAESVSSQKSGGSIAYRREKH